MLNKKNIFLCLSLILVGFFVLKVSINYFDFNFKTLTADSGFDGGGGGSSSSGISDSNSDRDKSTSILGGAFTVELIISFFYFFIIFALFDNMKNRILVYFLVFLFYLIRTIILFVLTLINPYIFIVDIILFYITCLVLIPKGKGVNAFSSIDVSSDELKKYNLPNIEKLKEEFYDIYVKIQEAWSINDIEKARNVLSDNLFNMYKTQILTMVNKNQRNAMSDFMLVDAYINNIEAINDILVVKVSMEVYCKDYMINIKNEKVISGDSSLIHDYYYALTFTKSLGALNKNVCPNCNSKLSSGSSVKCEYCGSVINKKSTNFVLSDKKMIRQKIKY